MSHRDATRCVHAGLPAPVPGQPFLPGPVFAAPYHLNPEGHRPGDDGYGRTDNATVRRFEAALGELEGGEAVAFASGMAAISAVLLSLLRPGDTLIIPEDGYYLARRFAEQNLTERGITVRSIPTAGPYPEAVLAEARLILLESPANPGLDVCDIPALVERAHRHGAWVVVDNTTATPLGQQPLELGADLTVASDTKALTGHSDLILGHVAGRDPQLIARLREWRTTTGAIPGPFETWLAHRSLGTLELRLSRQSDNAARVVEALAARPEVTRLRWPGRPEDPAYPIAQRQMRRIPGVVTFELPSEAYATRFLRACRLVTAATSFGGLHTTADRRAQWGEEVPGGLIRLSVGCEDPHDLITDLNDAFDTASRQS